MSGQEAFLQAVSKWRQLLGDQSVLSQEHASRRYGPNTIAVSHCIAAALVPNDTDDVIKILRIANQYRVPLYPISTGNNWGYGSANPVVDDCVVVDLRKMNRILDFNRNLGVTTVEPGVTQQQLREYLDRHSLPCLVPVTGAGPHCSLLGNAIERGYGITPYTDHCGAIMGVKAVLPDGRLYHSCHSEMGAEDADKAFKWGLGPYLDGLFTQSNFGIVTAMSIALAPQPEYIESFTFSLAHTDNLSKVVKAVRKILQTAGGLTGGVNLMNQRRVLSMMEPYPIQQSPQGGYISPDVIRNLGQRNQVMSWTGLGAIYGEKKLVVAARSIIKKHLQPHVRRLFFITPRLLHNAERLAGVLPEPWGRRLAELTDMFSSVSRIINGYPSEIALPLSYWLSGERPRSGQAMNPARDGCGLIWYSPLVPMIPEMAKEYVAMVETTCREHDINPLITLTSLTDRCFDSTVPLLFKRDDDNAVKNARRCYQTLMDRGREAGFVPYRLGIQAMRHTTDLPGTFWPLVRQIKESVDPENILAPGRYSCYDHSIENKS